MPDGEGMRAFAYAQEFRDIIASIVRDEIEKLRPGRSIAVVQSISTSTKRCTVLFAGDTDPTPVRMYSIQPSAIGDVVAVEGPPGSRYIVDVLAGEAIMPIIRRLHGL